MGSFKGFNEDDGCDNEDDERCLNERTGPGEKRTNLRSKKNMTRERLLLAAADGKSTNLVEKSTEFVPPEALFKPPSSSTPGPARTPVKLKIEGDGTKCEVVEQLIETKPEKTEKLEDEVRTQPSDGAADCVAVNTGSMSDANDGKTSKLEKFEQRQKLIEEQNRKRKELLATALKNRTKQTSQEAQKLQFIQEELQKIDAMLTLDVKFLRNSIEEASLAFSEAQKRYDKAEKDFIDAKMNLFRIMERKELLTDHLCSIIEQNELRKAKKLTELMAKLDIEESTSVLGNNTEFESGEAVSLQELRHVADFNTLKKLETTENKPAEL